MLYENWFKNPGDVPLLLEKIAGYSQKTGPIRLMEVCGTHTMSIARSGIKSILPENVQLLSGPGCPVCVTPANIIDMILSVQKKRDPDRQLRGSFAGSRLYSGRESFKTTRRGSKRGIRLLTDGRAPAG